MDRTERSLNAFVGLNRTIDTLTNIVAKDAKRHDLNITEFGVLELLFNKGPQPVQRIRSRVLIASSSITYVVDCLERKQLVQRQRDVQDKRVTLVHLTETGQSLMEEIFPTHAQIITDSFSMLTDDELTTLQHVLKKLSAQTTQV
ncbi:MarR family transcriptional regulator, 2-MHQ and catechol-resistance regulon repressor [Staphylococcus auricularis]|uniref:MarR family transcriptional regulator n=2 Tax=Staphylococcus auricularis TaxID=29379 RepID=A0AAP8PP09_9STAP|nr:MarR family transcriptional regulator [Staphylococcus auricularis]MCG7341336.1 MarR family transcriptional regulator [Staphylococcus auricularis]MDC6327426.1 MarR family transcriptional regulator [Staphylococcus auricularis]MDN4534002.1 MarR family transcriptional regulator [Staphylococcus auricularis]PNZ67125.1 MarR family transcriptional regulator [Staphylococcus auricularis]QPT05946.1 MarR family transcriptional regulator [Staphylococcus auricularis]